LVAPIINTIVHEVEDGDMVVAIPAKVVVARIMEAMSKTTLVPIIIEVQTTLQLMTNTSNETPNNQT